MIKSMLFEKPLHIDPYAISYSEIKPFFPLVESGVFGGFGNITQDDKTAYYTHFCVFLSEVMDTNSPNLPDPIAYFYWEAFLQIICKSFGKGVAVKKDILTLKKVPLGILNLKKFETGCFFSVSFLNYPTKHKLHFMDLNTMGIQPKNMLLKMIGDFQLRHHEIQSKVSHFIEAITAS